MRVYLNGSTTPIATINSYSATSQFKQTLATIRVPGNVDAAHTIRIVAELDTVGHTVCIDRVDVTGVNPRLERWFDTVASTEHFTTTYEHNDLGQRITSTDPYATTDYLWTGQRLSGAKSPYVDTEYVYDGQGQRLRKTLTKGDESATTSYLYDGLDLLSLTEKSADSEQTLTYLYADSTTPVGALYQSSETTQAITFEIVPDSRGDVREMRDMQGSTFARFDYDAHGNIRAEEVFETDLIDEETARIITDLQPLRYAGYVWDSEIQLYYCSQRYYDPTIGAFISKDPIKADGELSFYAYCTGDPINRIDPSGLMFLGAGQPKSYYVNAQLYYARKYAVRHPGPVTTHGNVEKYTLDVLAVSWGAGASGSVISTTVGINKPGQSEQGYKINIITVGHGPLAYSAQDSSSGKTGIGIAGEVPAGPGIVVPVGNGTVKAGTITVGGYHEYYR